LARLDGSPNGAHARAGYLRRTGDGPPLPYLGPLDTALGEVSRFALGPGQAFDYAVGTTQIEALLAQYKARKGAAFDLQAFHDDLPPHGTVPVSVLAAACGGAPPPPPELVSARAEFGRAKQGLAAKLDPPKADWTWDDFLAAAKALTTGEGDKKVWGFGIPYFNFGLTPKLPLIMSWSSGVEELIQKRLWPLAAIVFLASITVPLLKLVSLAVMMLNVHFGWAGLLRDRTRLYRIVAAIGRWSMIDVFVLSALAALVRMGFLASVHAQVGAIAFAAVVILTMLASESFDPRLMWDAAAARRPYTGRRRALPPEHVQ